MHAAERRRGGQARPRGAEHLRALVDPDHLDGVAPHERLRDQAGAGRDVEHALPRPRADARHHRGAPARVLAEAERRAGAVVVARQAGEQLERPFVSCGQVGG